MTVDLNKLTALAGQVKDRQQAHTRPVTTKKPWKIRALGSDTTEVFIYDMIGEWGVTAQDFVNELATVTTANMDVRVNSEGGQVFDGVAIYEAIKRHPAKSTGYVDGLAASAASFIVMACDRVLMAKTARMMIHDAGIGGLYVEGNARSIRESMKEIEEFAALLDSLSDTIAGIYADKAGGTTESWRTEMSSDKWYNASEAVTAGLADGIVGEEDIDQPDPEPEPQETTDWWNPQLFTDLMKGVLG